ARGSAPEPPDLTPGKEYVLLLEDTGDAAYTPVNSTQGWYAVEAGAAIPGPANDVSLSPGVREALHLK
ncbi:hypothetical protein GL263_26380, partial [Streptomyces durbertensis]|nr:hypothetical protein [Streptomyces durbertensis]